jgi:hypothetical protein
LRSSFLYSDLRDDGAHRSTPQASPAVTGHKGSGLTVSLAHELTSPAVCRAPPPGSTDTHPRCVPGDTLAIRNRPADPTSGAGGHVHRGNVSHGTSYQACPRPVRCPSRGPRSPDDSSIRPEGPVRFVSTRRSHRSQANGTRQGETTWTQSGSRNWSHFSIHRAAETSGRS